MNPVTTKITRLFVDDVGLAVAVMVWVCGVAFAPGLVPLPSAARAVLFFAGLAFLFASRTVHSARAGGRCS